MNKKTNKKKKRRARSGDGERNKENNNNNDLYDESSEEVAAEKEADLCYEVKTSEIMGRYLVAKREIKAGEVILEEPALAVGPCAGCGLICVGCYRELDEDSFCKCKTCKWPMCSRSCPGSGQYTGHSRYECDALKECPLDYTDLEEVKKSYHALMPLRCLLLKKEDKEKWLALTAMESHNGIRKSRPDIWKLNEDYVVDRLINKWGMKFDVDEIHTICGILEVNAFEVGAGGSNARALYDRAYLLAHCCVPSTTHTDVERAGDRPLRIRAATAHRAGDLISLCYAYTLQCTLRRRDHLSQSKFFSCACVRCSDPTELGTGAAAVRCPRCRAQMLPTNPLDQTAKWACVGCDYVMPANQVYVLLDMLTKEFENIDANDVKGFENFLYKYRNVLFDTHYLFLSAKHSLSQLYGKVSDYMIHEMSESQLTRKIAICRDLMKVFDVIEPGYSRLRGITLYELHAPLMILTTRAFEKKAISKDNLRNRLKEIVGYLTESALILGFEPSNSSEGLMAEAARDALKKIKTWEQIIGKIS